MISSIPWPVGEHSTVEVEPGGSLALSCVSKLTQISCEPETGTLKGEEERFVYQAGEVFQSPKKSA